MDSITLHVLRNRVVLQLHSSVPQAAEHVLDEYSVLLVLQDIVIAHIDLPHSQVLKLNGVLSRVVDLIVDYSYLQVIMFSLLELRVSYPDCVLLALDHPVRAHYYLPLHFGLVRRG